MGLASFTPESHEFNFKGGSFTVEGLSLEALATLVQHHLPDLEALFDLFQGFDKAEGQDFTPLVVSLIQQAPGFCSNVIALAAGEPDSAKKAARLPFPLQIEVLLKIGDLTFTEVGGPKKSLEMIAALLKKNDLPMRLTKTNHR